VSGRDPELDRPELRRIDQTLTDYAVSTDDAPSPGFADWVMRSVANEPLPRRGLLVSLGLLLTTPGPYRMVAQAAVVVVIVVAGIGSGVAIGQIDNLFPDKVGTSPSPLPSLEASPPSSPRPTVSPTATPPPTLTPTRSAAPSPEESEEESETPEPSETPNPSETPEPN
jgi:hypothetical protein